VTNPVNPMQASTDAQVYRAFSGELVASPLRFWPLVAAGVRAAAKKKLALLLIYAIPCIAAIVFSFVVYLRYAASESVLPGAVGGGQGLVGMVAKRAVESLEVRNQIAEFCIQMRYFAMVAAVWYGGGLLSEDRRRGAHLLYFSRPMTRLDYLLGKFFTVAFFAACAVLVPGLLICLVATFSSPNFAFLKNEWALIPRTIAYAVIWVTTVSAVTLAASSLAPKRTYAMAGAFGFFMFLHAMGGIVGHVRGDAFFAISPMWDMTRLARWLLQTEESWPRIDPFLALGVVLGLAAISIAITVRRIRGLEVVG